jgi:hypothetical protein
MPYILYLSWQVFMLKMTFTDSLYVLFIPAPLVLCGTSKCSRRDAQLAYWQRINAMVYHHVIYSPDRNQMITQQNTGFMSHLLHNVIMNELAIFSLCWPPIRGASRPEWVPLCSSLCFLHFQWAGLAPPPLRTSSRKPWIQATARISAMHSKRRSVQC